MTAASPTFDGTQLTTAYPARRGPTFWQRVGDLPWTWVGVTVLIAYCLFPFLWLVRLSMDPTASGKLLPSTFTLHNYAEVFAYSEFMRGFLNSVIVSSAATAIAMCVGGAAAYA